MHSGSREEEQEARSRIRYRGQEHRDRGLPDHVFHLARRLRGLEHQRIGSG